MARRFVLVVAALALMVGMGASTVGVATVAAQTGRTAPPTVDLTCHGYDEGATRAYNCIPEPSQQHHYADVRSSRWVGLRCGQHRRVSRRSDRLPDPVP